MGEVTNTDRADWAEVALYAFCKEVYCARGFTDLEPEEQVEAVADLICDLQHLMRLRLGMFADERERLVRGAIRTSEIELVEDPDGEEG